MPNLIFNLAYSMMIGPFYASACQMDLRVFGGSQINGAFFNVGDCLSIVVFVPLLENYIIPRWCQERESQRSDYKILIGFLF